MRRTCTLTLGLAVLLFASHTATAQVVDAHDVERIEAADVGPYRPQRQPDLAEVREQVVERVNEFRREHDREPLTTNRRLEQTAAEFAQYMARTDRYGHTADGRRPAERAREQGYEFCIVSENIAYQFHTRGFETAELARGFFTGWRESPRHRENMLDPDLTETGVAVAQSESTGVFYGVQMFGRPQTEAIEFSITNPTDQPVQYRIGERVFELPPRYTRTHTQCRPPQVELLPADAEPDAEPIETVRPQGGEQFQVVADRDRVRLEQTAAGDNDE